MLSHIVRWNTATWTFLCFVGSQGLGTSTAKEGKEYFRDIDKHKKSFIWSDEQDGEAIELAFSKKKIEARKNWLRQFEVIVAPLIQGWILGVSLVYSL